MSNAELTKAHCSWPIPLYLSAMLFAVFTLALFTPTLTGQWINAARGGMQALVLFVFLGRLLLAIRRREQSRVWIAYVVVLFLATPLWLLLEPVFFELFYLGRSFWSR